MFLMFMEKCKESTHIARQRTGRVELDWCFWKVCRRSRETGARLSLRCSRRQHIIRVMKVLILSLFIALLCAVTGFAKGPGPVELTPELIKEKNIPWQIEVTKEDYIGEINFQVLIKLLPTESKDEVDGRLVMIKDHSYLIRAPLNPGKRSDGYVVYSFSVAQSQLSNFAFEFYTPLGHQIYMLKLSHCVKSGQ